MPAVDFFDAGVFIYAVDPAEPAKQQIARELLAQSARPRPPPQAGGKK